MGSPTPYRLNSCREGARGSAQRSGSTCQVFASALSSLHLQDECSCEKSALLHTVPAPNGLQARTPTYLRQKPADEGTACKQGLKRSRGASGTLATHHGICQ